MDGKRRSEAARETESAAAVEADRPEIVHDGLGQSFRADPERPILDAALEQDVEMEYGCRVGACGACAVEVLEGLENLEEPDFIEHDALTRYGLPAEVRLACRARARGCVRLRALD